MEKFHKFNKAYKYTLCLSVKVAQLYLTLQPCGLYSPWNSPGQSTGVGSLSLLRSIFPTQRSNPGLLHCRQILYQLSHQGSLRILEWVAYPFSSGSSWPRNWIGVSCAAGRFFTNWAIREAWPRWVGYGAGGPRGRRYVCVYMYKYTWFISLYSWN